MKKFISLIAVTTLMIAALAVPVAAAGPTPTTFTVREAVKCNSCSLCLGLDGQTAKSCGSYIVPVWVTNNGGNAEGRFLTGATFEVTIDDSKLEWFFPRGKSGYNLNTDPTAQRSWPFILQDAARSWYSLVWGSAFATPSAGQFDGNTATFSLANIYAEKQAEAFILAVRVKPKASFTKGDAAITLNVESPVGSTNPGSVVSGGILGIVVNSGKVTLFGDVPGTGIADMTGATMMMFAFLALAAALWVYILRRKLIEGSNG